MKSTDFLNMSTDFRAALERLISAYDEHGGRWTQTMHDEDPLDDAVERARADLAAADPDPAEGGEALLAVATAAEGEVAELVAALRADAECVAAEQPDLMQLTNKQLTRAADLLECLELVAYAASDFICGTRFPEFANEHGGIDRLMADLCRLVAQFEHGPRPVPGVDVPGPDGDWGGLAELCNAEGLDPRIGVPLLQRAREAWKYASQTDPVPAEGELVAWLNNHAAHLRTMEGIGALPETELQERLDRAATLLQQQAAELAALRTGVMPVAVSERPWEREGWCDEQGRCWFLSSRFLTWSLASPPVALTCQIARLHSLPSHAIPLPPQGGEVV